MTLYDEEGRDVFSNRHTQLGSFTPLRFSEDAVQAPYILYADPNGPTPEPRTRDIPPRDTSLTGIL